MLDLLGLIGGIGYIVLLASGLRVTLKRTSYHDADRAIRFYVAAGAVELFTLGAHITQLDWLGIALNVGCLILLFFMIRSSATTADEMKAEASS